MAVLTLQGLADKQAWEKAGIALPSFDAAALKNVTRKYPRWAHIGPGNIFRGYVAVLAQELIEQGKMDSGVTVISTFDQQVIDKIYRPYDDLSLQVLMHADGKLDKKVVASVGESIKADSSEPAGFDRSKVVFADPGLQMVSFTITEKGYQIKDISGAFFPAVVSDFRMEQAIPQNGMAIVTALLLHRYEKGAAPIAMVSMDNFSHNGDKLKDSITTIAGKWVENHFAPPAFLDWLNDSGKVGFPCTMIDKITPRPDPSVSKSLSESGFESTELVVTDKNTYIAPFVNAEVPQYLVVEDQFPGGRPSLEDAGVYITDRNTVDQVERMKVCTCLNPLHTAMSVIGCLLGFTSIAAEMKDEDIRALVVKIGRDEGMPVVTDPGILSPADFLREVMEARLPNPYIPDTPQRIATDTSQKLAIRFGETIKLYRSRDDLDTTSLTCIPLALAAWCRYLLGVDDQGNAFDISPDPLMEQLKAFLSGVEFGKPASLAGKLLPLLSNANIFGVDLYEDGLGEKVEGYVRDMLAGPGAVRKTLHEAVGQIT